MEEYDPTAPPKFNTSQGKIIKGTINDADFKMGTSSIPSKYDSLITRSQTISAFGSGVNRFRARDNAESPGPGSYTSRNRQSPSLSKKGSGPFVSKLDRSITNKMKSVPGPGTYSSPMFKPVVASKFGKSERSNQIFREAKRHTKQPGPGAYQNTKVKSHSELYTSIFRSNVKRNMQYISDTPNPTSYRPKVNTFDGRSFSIKKPVNIIRKENVFNSYFGTEKEKLGPGSYNPVDSNSPKRAFLMKDSSHDRFGHVKEQYKNSKKQNLIVPGPGAYNAPSLDKSVKKLRSMFISKTERKIFDDSKDNPPYYAYETQNKKIFHTNHEQKWV